MTVVYVSDILEFLAASIFTEEMSMVIKWSGYIRRQSFGPRAEGKGASVWFRPMGMVFTKTSAVQPSVTQCKSKENGTDIKAVILSP
jgi:hypothetical protein